MKPKWTGEVVKRMHIHGITQRQLAKELGVTPAYVCMILGGAADTPETKKKVLAALDGLIAKS